MGEEGIRWKSRLAKLWEKNKEKGERERSCGRRSLSSGCKRVQVKSYQFMGFLIEIKGCVPRRL